MKIFFGIIYAKYGFVFFEIEKFEKGVTTNDKRNALFFDAVRHGRYRKYQKKGLSKSKKKEGRSRDVFSIEGG